MLLNLNRRGKIVTDSQHLPSPSSYGRDSILMKRNLSLLDVWIWRSYLFMNLVAFSIKTKGAHNFVRRLWTVFARFGFSERPNSRALHALLKTLQPYHTGPTFFIPAVVLKRHPKLISEIARQGAEIGIHGYVHNDYRTLSAQQQYIQTQQAIEIFHKTR